MKISRVFCAFIIVAAVLFASTLSVGAIGFEAEKAYESVFVIYSGNSMGSGFAIGENCIVTNAHVIDDENNITVATYGGTTYEAFALGINQWEDIAVLIVKNASFPYLKIADLSAIKTGDDIYAIGAPKGMTYTLTKGGVSAKERKIGDQTYIQIDAAINEGNSGGPLLNDAGQVLGMNSMKISDSEGIGFAIPISRVCDYLKTLGVGLDKMGNVAGSVTIPEETPPTEGQPGEDNEENYGHQEGGISPTVTYAAVCIAVLSLIGNMILASLLKNEKKKSATLKYDPRERTDFEIDILE